jgi:hypothetical protein
MVVQPGPLNQMTASNYQLYPDPGLMQGQQINHVQVSVQPGFGTSQVTVPSFQSFFSGEGKSQGISNLPIQYVVHRHRIEQARSNGDNLANRVLELEAQLKKQEQDREAENMRQKEKEEKARIEREKSERVEAEKRLKVEEEKAAEAVRRSQDGKNEDSRNAGNERQEEEEQKQKRLAEEARVQKSPEQERLVEEAARREKEESLALEQEAIRTRAPGTPGSSLNLASLVLLPASLPPWLRSSS